MNALVPILDAVWLMLFESGPLFNAWSSALTGIGVLFTVLGFVIAIIRINKTRKSAEAAREAAMHTSSKLLKVGTLVDLTRAFALSRETKTLLRESRWASAALRLSDLRDEIVKLRESPGAKSLQSPVGWQVLVTELRSLEESLEQYDSSRDTDGATNKRLNGKFSEIHDKVNGLAAQSEHSVGAV